MTEISVSSTTTLLTEGDPTSKIMDISSAKKPPMGAVRISTVHTPITKLNNSTIPADTKANSVKNTTIHGKMRLTPMIPNLSNLYVHMASSAPLLMLIHNYQSSS